MHGMICKPTSYAAPEGRSALQPSLAGQSAALPAWDLSDLYPSTDSPRIKADLDAAEAAARAFAGQYAGRLAELPGGELAQALATYERIEEQLGRVMSFAQLMFSGDGTDSAIGGFM